MRDEHSVGTGQLDRRTLLELAGGSLAVTLAGCLSPRQEPITDSVPMTTFLVGIDGAITDDQETAQVLDAIGDGENPLADGFESQTGLDFDRVDQLLLSGTSAPGELAPAEADRTVVRGDFTEDEVKNGFEDATGIAFTETSYKDQTLYLLRPGEGNTDAFAHLGNGTFVYGSRSGVETALDVSAGDSDPVSGPALDAYESVREDALVWFGIDVPEQPPDEVPDGVSEPLETLAGGYYTPDDGVRVVLPGDASSEQAAQEVESQIKTIIAEFAQESGPLAEALLSARVERDGEQVTVTYSPTVDEFLRVIEALGEGQVPGPGPTPVPGDDVTNQRTGRTFGSIQAAIDDDTTEDGDAIVVSERPSDYHEEVAVTKSVTILGSPEATLDGNDGDLNAGISVQAPGVVLQNLTVQGFGGSGIELLADNVRLTRVRCENNNSGISVEGVEDAHIEDTFTVANRWNGIELYGATNPTLDVVQSESNEQTGLVLVDVDGATVQDSNFTDNAAGLAINGGTDVTLERFFASFNQWSGLNLINVSGLEIHDGHASDNQSIGLYGVEISDVDIQELGINSNDSGALLFGCSNVELNGVEITGSQVALDIFDSAAVSLRSSAVTGNTEGIGVARSTGSLANFAISSNDIFNNNAFGLVLEPAVDDLDRVAATAEVVLEGDPESEAFYESLRSSIEEYETVRSGMTVRSADSEESLPATGNWWGDASGPSGDGPGTGDAVFGNVAYEPWSTSSGPDWNMSGRRET